MTAEFLKSFANNLNSELDLNLNGNQSKKIADIFVDSLLQFTRSTSDAVTFKGKLSFKRVLRKSRVFILPDKTEHLKDDHYVFSTSVLSDAKKRFEDKKVDRDELKVTPTKIKPLKLELSKRHDKHDKHERHDKHENHALIIKDLEDKITKKKIITAHKSPTSAWSNDDDTSDDEAYINR